MGEKIIVTVQGQVRGVNSQEAFGFVADSGSITTSWGLQPGTAIVSWVKEATDNRVILPLAAMTIEIGGDTFYGLCGSAVAVESHDGRNLSQSFNDSRMLLQYDWIYAQFNMREQPRLVNGRYVNRYRHLLPANFNAHLFTYTDTPMTAKQILNYCFGAVTVESPWTRYYQSNASVALNNPVLQVDAYSGKRLGTLISEVSQRCGTDFTLAGGRYRLEWTVKGVGVVPSFPANSTSRRVGLSVTENPTRLRILGDRNQYQVLNVTMEKDWKEAWQAFVDVDLLADDLFRNEKTEAAINGIPAGTRYNAISGDTDQLIGRQLSAARARTITVEQYAALRDIGLPGSGEQYRDRRRAFGQSRLQMPAVTYIQTLLFRAFRPPSNFGIYNYQGQFMSLVGMELQAQGLTDITHDAATGVMSVVDDQRMVGNGYAIARGYAVGVDGFKTLRPGNFRVADWVSGQNVWQALSYQIDDSGEDGKFILFNEPVVVSSDLITTVSINSVVQAYPALKRSATITVPPVKAALVFAGERFSWVQGNGTRDDCENVSGLNGLFVVVNGILGELMYADGQTASQKAYDMAINLLNRQFYVTSGGYEVQGSNATPLSSMIDRKTVSLDGASGLSEQVDFQNERQRGVDGRGRVQIEPVQQFERVAQLAPLLPGERENREAANQLRVQASALRQNPKIARLLFDTFYSLMGLDAPPDAVFLKAPGATPLPAGTPLFAESGDEKPWAPEATLGLAARLTTPVFMGSTVFDGELPDGPVRGTRSGGGGVIHVRVKGPVAFGDSVGIPKDPDDTSLGMAVDYLEGTPFAVVGTVQQAVADGVIAYVRVRVTGGGGAAAVGMIHRGEWNAEVQYAYQNVVSRGILGEFVMLQAGAPLGLPPETGAPYWHGWSWPAPGSWA